VGIDCVAMVVNDIVVQGAEPLIFLDYLAMGELDADIAAEALRGVAEGCRRAGCALLGGETATMPGFYPKGELELVGFAVGVAERERLIDGSSIGVGDVVIGIASNGLHSNGFSLVRRIVEDGERAGRVDLRAAPPELNTSVASALITPTRIYVKPILSLVRDFTLHGVVHITGGGFIGNVPRVLPRGVRARIDPAAWPRPPIFGFLQRQAELEEDEMLRVFNCGIGMVLIVPRDAAQDIRERLDAMGERSYEIGVIERKDSDEEPGVLFAPQQAKRRTPQGS
jgi:phosphoribosylformylglycinamidine cyclo-ligase